MRRYSNELTVVSLRSLDGFSREHCGGGFFFEAGLDALKSFGGARWLVLGEMKELGDASNELHAEVGRYATFIWEHLGREEGVILPAAERHLTAEDWDALATAFAANREAESAAQADAEYRRLFSRIVNVAGA